MRKLLLLGFLIAGLTHLNAQTVTYEDIQKIKKGKMKTYVASTGEVFSIGDTITLGVAFRNEAYDYIQQNAGIAYYPLPNVASGSEVFIKKMNFYKKMVIIKTTKPNGYVYGLIVLNLEGAIANGELLSEIMTREQAIAKLKESKGLLDLEIITQEEYDALKTELTPIIKGN